MSAAGPPYMQNVQALREIKRAEADVREQQEQAARQAGEILRDAERKATALIEQAKADADAAFSAGVKRTQDDVSRDREKILKASKADADALRAKAKGPELGRAVEMVLKNFEARVAGRQ